MQDVPPEVAAGSLDEGTLDQEQQHRQSQDSTSALTAVPPQPAGMAPPAPPPPPQQQQQQQQQQQEEHEQEPQPAPIAPPSTTPAIRSTGTTLHSTRQRRSPTQTSVAAAAAGAVESRSPVLPRQQVETDEDHKAGDIESFTAAAAAAAAPPTANDAGAPPTHEYNISGTNDAGAPPTHEYNISGNLVPVSPTTGAGVGARAGGSGDAEEPRDDDANKKEDETLNFYEWRDVFPELEALASGLPEIMAECLQVASWKAWPEKHYEEGGGQDWKVFPFLHTFPAYDESRRTWVESSCKRCPKTAAILRRLPNIRTALFSRLGGGSRISGHRGWADLANHVLRCHLPIKVPSDGVCGLWVESEVRRHVEGEIIVFDDSKLHKAFNECTEERLVLIVDLLRPPGVPLGTADGDHTPELDAFIDAFR